MQGSRDVLLREKFMKGLPESYQFYLQQIPNLTYEGLQLPAQQLKAAEDYRLNKTLPKSVETDDRMSARAVAIAQLIGARRC